MQITNNCNKIKNKHIIMTKTRKSRRKVGGSVENVHNTDPLVIASELKNIVTNIMNIMILKLRKR